MNKLPVDFEYHNYGIDARMVNESDAEFILSLRTNPTLNQYIHATDNDVEKQRDWIRAYKQREAEGLEYYFLYSMDGMPFGLDRVYRINQSANSYVWGSWVCKPDITSAQLLLQYVSSTDIINNHIGLDLCEYNVDKGNLKVLYFHRKTLRSNEIGETEFDVLFSNTKQMREESCKRFKRILGLKD